MHCSLSNLVTGFWRKTSSGIYSGIDCNRKQVQDIVLIITDGATQDNVKIPSQRLRDTGAQTFLKDFPDNQQELLAKFDKIPYNGPGTRAGQAIDHVTDVILAPENGNRKQVQDIVLIITDGPSQDNVKIPSQRLRHRTTGSCATHQITQQLRVVSKSLIKLCFTSHCWCLQRSLQICFHRRWHPRNNWLLQGQLPGESILKECHFNVGRWRWSFITRCQCLPLPFHAIWQNRL